ncbi:MAG: hypothetical protein ACI4C1_04745 [Lachnospiraceae bacterium]
MENKNQPSLPESLVMASVQRNFKELLKTYPLPMHVWYLLVKDFLRDVETLYQQQLKEDSQSYQKMLKEQGETHE